ncbi:MAG TPA: SRPBCC domain-containing protein [Ktedonobacteraceae bacterium]
MDFSGSQKIIASREQVYNALLDPAVLKASISGVESAEYVNDQFEGRALKLVLVTPIPGFKGPYEIYLKTQEAVAPSHLVLVASPSSDVGSIKAALTIDLTDDVGGTNLNYNTHAEASGKIGAVPDMVVKPIVKGQIDKFFSSFEKQVSSK